MRRSGTLFFDDRFQCSNGNTLSSGCPSRSMRSSFPPLRDKDTMSR